jgi:hypothetical protein
MAESKPDNDREDNRNTSLNDPAQANQAIGKSTGEVSQNTLGSGNQTSPGTSGDQGSSSSPSQPNQQGSTGHVGQQEDTSTWQRENKTQPQRKPGQEAPSLGQESGTDWQESQQAGYTGRTGVQNPQEK